MAAPTRLIMPFPSPEEKYPQRIVIADITKEMEIILSAGMPSSSISELAENNCSNCPGKHQNITVPRKAMIAPVGSRKSFQHFLNAQSVYQVVKEPGPVKQDNQESMETKEYISRSEAAALAGVTSGTITKWMQMAWSTRSRKAIPR